MENLRVVSERINHRAGYLERRVWDEDRQAVRVVKERLETALPALSRKVFRCRACEDKGMVQVPFEYTMGNLLIQTTTRAFCHCPAGSVFAGYVDPRTGYRYMSVRDLTGTWVSVEMHANTRTDVSTPSTPQVPMQRIERQDGSTVWEQDLSHLDNDDF